MIAPGRFAGGVTVDVSVAIVGAGAGSTIIKGGGPVLTIGVFGAATEPTVSITGVTITGGVATSTPAPDGPMTFVARGGGVFIPGSAGGVGATVTIRNSLITGNRASPSFDRRFRRPMWQRELPVCAGAGRRHRRRRQADADQHDRQQQHGRRPARERCRGRRHLDRHQGR